MNPEANERQSPKEGREDHHLISPTAKLVAHLRAKTDIPYSAQIDELCEAGKTTEELFGDDETLSWLAAMLELRYKSLTELLHREMKEKGIKQVLELACGVLPRGLIESEDPSVQYVETDLADMADEKLELVRKIEPKALERPNYSVHSLNVLDTEQLAEIMPIFGDGKIAIINEGLLPYLSHEEKAEVAKSVHAILKEKGGVWITPDLSSSNRMKKIITSFPGVEKVIEKLARAVGRDIRANSFGNKEISIEFYRSLGFKVSEFAQGELVENLVLMDNLKDQEKKGLIQAFLDDSLVWVLEVDEEQST